VERESEIAKREWPIYAALASDYKKLFLSERCKTWEDRCWAMVKVRRLVFIHLTLLGFIVSSRKAHSLLVRWDQATDLLLCTCRDGCLFRRRSTSGSCMTIRTSCVRPGEPAAPSMGTLYPGTRPARHSSRSTGAWEATSGRGRWRNSSMSSRSAGQVKLGGVWCHALMTQGPLRRGQDVEKEFSRERRIQKGIVVGELVRILHELPRAAELRTSHGRAAEVSRLD
jgi:hypothetical protein